MHIFDILKIEPLETKVHLAVWNGKDDPLDLYFDGTFKEWQERQNKRNFQRKYICSLIRFPGENLWLFAGIYESLGIYKTEEHLHFYQTSLTDVGMDLRGRLIVRHKRKGRNSYPKGESLIDTALVYEVKPEPLAFSDFKNFKEVKLTRQQLELLFSHKYPSWRSALSSVAGVYLLSDRNTGKLYVGSAYGQGGIWARWADYAKNYHGGNLTLKKLLKTEGEEAFALFTYSILETCDLDLPEDLVISIENRWKDKLLTREFGFNKN